MSRLTLLGTVHRDPRGLSKLVEDLVRLTPQIITLELSGYGLRYRLKNKRALNDMLLRGLIEIRGSDNLNVQELKKLLQSNGLGGIRALLDLPFEYKGATFYSKSKGIPLYCLDISSFSRQLLSHVNELLSTENLKKVITFETASLRQTVAREYRSAEALLLDGGQSPWMHPDPLNEAWAKRERIMSKRIRKLVTQYPGHHIVHIGGWQHLAAHRGTLFNRLGDYQPKRVLLGHLQ
jgi:hypothetical protein